MRQINFPVTMTDIIVCTPTTQNIQGVAFKIQNILFLESRCYVKAIRRLPRHQAYPNGVNLRSWLHWDNDYDVFWDKVYVCVDKNTYNNKYLEEYA